MSLRGSAAKPSTKTRKLACHPRASVVSRKIGKDFGRGFVGQASETSSIVVGDKAKKESVAIGMATKDAFGRAAFGFMSDGLTDATVEAFDHSVGLRSEWSR